MKTYVLQYRTGSNKRWQNVGKVRARTLAGAIAQIARLLSDIESDSLEIGAYAESATSGATR